MLGCSRWSARSRSNATGKFPAGRERRPTAFSNLLRAYFRLITPFMTTHCLTLPIPNLSPERSVPGPRKDGDAKQDSSSRLTDNVLLRCANTIWSPPSPSAAVPNIPQHPHSETFQRYGLPFQKISHAMRDFSAPQDALAQTIVVSQKKLDATVSDSRSALTGRPRATPRPTSDALLRCDEHHLRSPETQC